VIERHPHASQLPYIRPGMDTTVWFGYLDMKFRNTTDGYIYAEVYGPASAADTQVKLWSEPLYMGKDYSKWITYMTKTVDGKVVYDGVLHKDTYEALIDEKGKTIPPKIVNVEPVKQ
jgi:hypothetical protein